jgi:hypothetical protein
MKKHNLLLIAVILILLPYLSSAQSRFHSDPNVMERIDPDNNRRPAPTVNGIQLLNNNAQDMRVVVSSNNKTWDTVKLPANTMITYNTLNKYIKIYTNDTKYCQVQLSAGNTYTIYWNNNEKRWDVR